MNKKPVYLKGLNGLRAIAALAVVFSHTTIDLFRFGLNSYVFGKSSAGDPQSTLLAGFGVSIFFALSGFLITYLLLLEKEKQEINIKKFYIRRILRIWPLYYLYLIFAVFIIYIIDERCDYSSLLLLVFYSANVPFILQSSLPFLGHYWSLGVEEQFYSFWPWVIKKSNKKLLYNVVFLIVILIVLKLYARYFTYEKDDSLLYRIIHVTRFHCMLIGAIGAILYFESNKYFLKIVPSKIGQLSAWLIILLLAINKFHIASVLDNEFISVVAVFLIVGQITVKNRIINLEIKIFDFLGKISYGIYVSHVLIIFGLSKVLGDLDPSKPINYLLVYCLVIATTILISYLSYNYFETWFLRLKDKYTVVPTSNSSNLSKRNNEQSANQIEKEVLSLGN